MKFTDFSQVARYLEEYSVTVGVNCKVRTYRLERMKKLMATLGNPQNCYKTIHIAGSKGKGSTASFIARGLKACGFKTGLYMSPHVTDIRERFTLCGTFFDDETLVNVGNKLYDSLSSFTYKDESGESCPTTFELYTAYAFLLFKEAGCHWAVIETGLGGRLDATNILSPQASVITPIELEHTEILGDTIEAIAVEKSKIIKPKCPVFISIQKPEAEKILCSEAKAQNSPIYKLSDNVRILETETKERQNTHIVFSDKLDVSLNLKMLGKVQACNCALSILVLKTLNLFDKKSIKEIEENTIPARMEKIEAQRTIFIDGAHTKNSMSGVMDTFRQLYPKNTGICIFGCLSDKRYDWMASIVLENFDKVVITKPGTYKKSNPEGLYRYIKTHFKSYKEITLLQDTKEALKYCFENTEENEPVLVCGSFYLAGAVKEALCR